VGGTDFWLSCGQLRCLDQLSALGTAVRIKRLTHLAGAMPHAAGRGEQPPPNNHQPLPPQQTRQAAAGPPARRSVRARPRWRWPLQQQPVTAAALPAAGLALPPRSRRRRCGHAQARPPEPEPSFCREDPRWAPKRCAVRRAVRVPRSGTGFKRACGSQS